MSQYSHRTRSMTIDGSGTSSSSDPFPSLPNSRLLMNSPFDVWLRFIHHAESTTVISPNLNISVLLVKGLKSGLSQFHGFFKGFLDLHMFRYYLNDQLRLSHFLGMKFAYLARFPFKTSGRFKGLKLSRTTQRPSPHTRVLPLPVLDEYFVHIL
jgi:hypothetical protein